MALRSDTTYQTSHADTDFETGKNIIVTGPDSTADNQDLVLRRKRTLFTGWHEIVSTAAAGNNTIYTYAPVLSGDLCGWAATSTSIAVYVYCWTDDGATTFTIRAQETNTNTVSSLSVVGDTTPTWRELTTTGMTWTTDGTDTPFRIQGGITAGGGTCYACGIFIVGDW